MKTIILGIFWALITSIGISAQAFNPFFIEAADDLVERQILHYQSDPIGFRFDEPILRQEGLGIAIKSSDYRMPDSYPCHNFFSDVSQVEPNYWFCVRAEIATSYGIISIHNKNFYPESNLSRSEAMAMLITSHHLTGESPDFYSFPEESEPWQKRIISTAKKHGLISDTRTSRPNDNISRGEFILMSYRAHLAKNPLIYPSAYSTTRQLEENVTYVSDILGYLPDGFEHVSQTIFLPTNTSLSIHAQDIGITYEDLIGSPEKMSKILADHSFTEYRKGHDLIGSILTNKSDSIHVVGDYRIDEYDAYILDRDIQIWQSILHIVDTVIAHD